MTKKKSETNKRKKTKKIEKKKIDAVDIIMISIMVLLGIFIIYMCFQLKAVSSKKDEVKANIVIPVIEKNANSEIKLTLEEFKKGAIYTLKVTNFRNNKINKKEMTYNIRVKNNNEEEIGIYKNKSKDNLVKEGQEFVIENNKLKAKEKQTDIYQIKLLNEKDLKKDSVLVVTIES